MEAGHLGAGREHSMGLNILLPFEQAANRIIAGDAKLVHMKYFFTRKLMFVKESDAVCLLPGGFGTLDEGLEVLTLLQTGKRDMIPVVFLDEPGGDYWSGLEQFIRGKLLARGMIAGEDMHLYPPHRPRGRGGGRDPRLLPRLPQHALRAREAGLAADRAAKRRAAGGIARPISPTSSAAGNSRSAAPLPEERDEPLLGRCRG